MDKHIKETDLFEQYTDDTATESEKEQIAVALKKDKKLAENFDEFSLLTDGIKYAGRKKLIRKLKLWDTEMPDVSGSERKGIKLQTRWYHAAAVFCLLAAAGLAVFSVLDSGNDSLVAEYYAPYEYIPHVTRGALPADDALDKIYSLYDQGDYEKTIRSINALENSGKDELTAFILANSYQAVDQFREAVLIYEKLAKSSNEFALASEWYLALCYLSLEQPDDARLLLESLQHAKSSYAPKAKALLEEL